MIQESMGKPLSFLAVFACALVACKGGGAAGSTGAPAATTASYASKNGLLTAHYPADFAAATTGTSSIVLSRNHPGGLDEAMVLIPIETPISTDLHVFAREIGAGEVKDLPGYVETSSLPATCVGVAGIETTGTWKSERGALTYLRKACHFIHNGHGYSIAYSVSSPHAAEEEPKLRAIREATQLAR
ncbi:MAG: hypothetical protein ABI134_14885 [Byssovorax sp.]